MSGKILTPDENASPAKEATQRPESSDETERQSARLFPKRRTRIRMLGLLLGGMALILSLAIYNHISSQAEDSKNVVVQEPTSAERFENFFEGLVNSEETVARLDAFVIDDEMLSRLTTIDRLTIIQVNADSVSLPTIVKIASLPKLEQLHLRGAEIDDAMLGELAKSSTLWLLNLPVCKAAPTAIEELGSMVALRQLRLGIKGGDNRHGRAVATLSRLRSVHLIGVSITDEGLRPLSQMPQLESLYLDDTAVTDTGWTWLFRYNPQLHVHVNQKHHDRDPQKH